jgi:methyl-accepting chemotaxis protein
MDGMTLVLGPTPDVEGTSRLGIADADGKLWVQAMIETARQGGGTVGYRYPKPGSTEAQPKLAYVQPIPNWNMFVATGLYIDDLRAAAMEEIVRFGLLGGSLFVFCMTVTWTVSRGITRPLARLRASMAALANGDLATEPAGIARSDEIGEMAGTVQVFREHMIKEAQYAAEQETERHRAEVAKRDALIGMAERIETETGAALHQISARSAAMATAAESMTQSAVRTGSSAETAASAAGQIRGNAQMVASATEELAASIREIGSQVSQSTVVIGEAVTAGTEARATIELLNQEVQRIGAVAEMIGEIASGPISSR